MNGVSIFGVVTVIMSVLVMFWGGIQHPINLMDSEFMSYITSGVVFITIGLYMINGLPNAVKIIGIVASAATLMLYIYGFEGMDFILKLMSFVPVIGFAAWLIYRVLL